MDTDKIVITGSHDHGYTVEGWQDGVSAALVTWCGVPDDGETVTRVVRGQRELLILLGAIGLYSNTELVSAELLTDADLI